VKSKPLQNTPKNIYPDQVIRAQRLIIIANITLGIIWIYQGLIPKLLFPETGEIDIIIRSGLFPNNEKLFLAVFGSMEIIFGVLFLIVRRKVMHSLNVLGLVLLTLGAVFSDLSLMLRPLNPFSLNLAMIIISVIALLNFSYISVDDKQTD
jgi:hypothetical protein